MLVVQDGIDFSIHFSTYEIVQWIINRFIREVPDFPKPGILFYDITTLLKEPICLRAIIDDLVQQYQGIGIAKVVGMESRGFILGSPLAYHLNAGVCACPKTGKNCLPMYLR